LPHASSKAPKTQPDDPAASLAAGLADLNAPLDMEHWLKLFPPTPADLRKAASTSPELRGTGQKQRGHDPRRARG
jgi:hypothetical protein